MMAHRDHAAESDRARDGDPHEHVATPSVSFARRSVADHRDAVRALVAGIERPTERVALFDPELAGDRCLAEDVLATSPLPPFDNSQMDGFAVRSADLAGASGELAVTGHVAAGDWPGALPPGQAWAIMTGAPVPEGADAIVPIEASGLERFPGTGEAASLRVLAPVAPGAYVRPAGSDVAAGELLLAAGAPLTAPAIGLLASAGLSHVPVRRRLRVLVVATGSELVDAGADDRAGSILDANTPALLAVVRAAGAVGIAAGHVPDDPARFLEVLSRFAPEIDLVVTAGGVSKGAHEVVREALAPRGVAFGSVAMQPGGPQGLGVAHLTSGRLPVVALPGNPVSALVSAEAFLRPALRAANGWWHERPIVSAPLAQDLESPAGREQHRRGLVDADGRIELVGGPSSHLLASFARSSLLVRIPADRDRMAAGDVAEAWRIDE